MKNKINDIRSKFPMLNNGFIYFDSSSTSLKPNSVIEAEADFYRHNGYNVMRSNSKATDKVNKDFMDSLDHIARFLGVTKEEMSFTYNATYAANEISSFIEKEFHSGDEIIISDLEHASNYLPWVKLSKKHNLVIRKYKVDQFGHIDINHLKTIVNSKTKVVAFASTFNTIGTNQNVNKIVRAIKEVNKNTLTIVDATQTIGHSKVNFKEWDVDFAFGSAHKAFGPMGLGFWYGKLNLLEKYEPVHFGGGMNVKYSEKDYTLGSLPNRLIAGTPNVGGILAFGKSIQFIEDVGIDFIEKHTFELKKYLESKLEHNFNIEIINKGIDSSIFLFNINGVNPKQVEDFLTEHNMVARSGQFCVKTNNEFVTSDAGAVRVSLHVYNTFEELDKLINLLNNTKPGEILALIKDFKANCK